MDEQLQILIHLLAALAVGLLIGIERGWSGRQEEEGARVAGLRTFSLIGLLGGVFAEMSKEFGEWVLIAAFLAISAMIIVGHIQEARKSGDIGTTTAFSMMLTFALAAWAAMGQYVYALGTTVVVVALLGMKPVLHRWVSNIETEEIYAGIKLLIISVVLLPLLPNQGYGPWEALNPRWVWWMVVLICGISFAGYFAIKHTSDRLGTLLTSVTGGLASSTAVTLSMAQFAKEFQVKTLFMGGVMIASSIMFIRVMIEVAIVNPALLHPLWIPLSIMFAGVLVSGYYLWKNSNSIDMEKPLSISNPFKLGMALKFGLLLAAIMLLTAAMQQWFGEKGVYFLSVFSALMDVDAITLSLSRLALGDLANETAMMGIVLAAATNTVVKGFIFAFFVGFRESLKLIGFLVLAVIPGLVTAFMML
jgi:uncharacterized membrane protein (DUF4010 family)